MYDLFLLAKELGSFGSAAWISKGRVIQNGIFLLFYKVETMARKRRQVGLEYFRRVYLHSMQYLW